MVNPEVRSLWLASYVQTYLERDIRQLPAVQDLRLFQVFLGLVAPRHGQELNLADVSRQAGVSQPTAKRWLSLLAAKDRPAQLLFWRSHDGLEVDLLLEMGRSVYPVEFKKTATPTAVHAEGLRRFRALAETKLDVATSRVVCRVADPTRLAGGVEAVSWQDYLAWVEGL